MTAICPYCSAEIEDDPERRLFCHACGTAHHRECWEENGGCTVFGCAAAPADEPKITVSSSDFAMSTPPPPPPPAIAPPPPPFDSSATPPPPLIVEVPRPLPTLTFGGYVPPATAYMNTMPVYGASAKNRTAYVLLGIFLGALGVHNFYAGFNARGGAQLAVTVLTLGYGAMVSWIWAIVEVCVVDRDSRNQYML